MVYRKMRTRMKRSTTKRPRRLLRRSRRRRPPYKNPNKPEVKYVTFSGGSFPHNLTYTSTPDKTLYGSQFIISNLLANILQGVGRGNRIGGKIYVKFMTFYIYVYPCPALSTYNVTNFHYRLLIHNTGATRVNSGFDIDYFFGSEDKINFNGLVDRSQINVYHDKTYLVTTPYPVNNALANSFNSAGRRIVFTLPIGRVVDFSGDGGNFVRNDRDYLCLSALIGVSGMNAVVNEYQIACSHINIRTYFTDV